MSQVPLAPPPQTGQPIDGWLFLLWKRLTATGQILWSGLSFTGSNLTDIETRNHADLQNLNTASYSHLTSTQVTDLTDAGDSVLHYHATDRDLANATGNLSVSRLNSGTGASGTTYWRGDATWVAPGSGGGGGLGDFSSNTSSSVDSEIVLFSSTGGKTGKRATTTGILKGTSGVLSAATAGTDYVDKGTTSVLTAGFSATPYSAGTKSTGTLTPDEANGNFQYYTNGGAHTLAPPTNNCTLIIQITNNGSAGAITTSGFTKVSGTAPVTTNTYKFIGFVTKINSLSHLAWQELQ